MSHDDDDGAFERGDSPAAWYQPPTTILEDARAPPSPLEHDMDTTMADHDTHTASFEHHEELDNRATQAEPDHYTVIEPLTDELAILDDGCGDWANEVEEAMGYTLQGEYTPANYSPTPAPPPPAPVHPPPPPTLPYTPPRPYYKPS